jgi:7,8-didemethyl-8-hydroxy-5-deazariboflavin synthase CofG subunit
LGSPDKRPAVRLGVIEAAGKAAIPFTSALPIGIGETRRERLAALLELRTLHECYSHLQEIIIQNFRAKPGTKMADCAEPSLDEHLWTIAAARLVFGDRTMSPIAQFRGNSHHRRQVVPYSRKYSLRCEDYRGRAVPL